MATTTYLRLFPAVKQFELKNGALNVGGRLFVYYDSTDDLAEIYDENGTRLQQPAILDNDGRALGLFVDAKKVYRLEVQDAFGAMQFTVRKMAPSGGGAGSALGKSYDVVSNDGSILVDKFDEGGTTTFDLSLGIDANELKPSCLKASAAPVTTDGKFVFDQLVREGNLLSVDGEGKVRMEPAWYHFTAIVELAYDGTPVNEAHQVTLWTTLSNSVVDLDTSYVHRESIELSGDIHVVGNNTEFPLGVSGLDTGISASLMSFDIHAVTGHEGSNEYRAGEGINIASSTKTISVDFESVQGKLVAGDNISIIGNVISAGNFSQEQADWTEEDTESRAYIKHKPDLDIFATKTEVTTGLAGKQNTIPDLAAIRSGATAGASAVQPSDLAAVATTGDYNSLNNRPNLQQYATKTEVNTGLAGKQDVISDLSTIRSGAQLGSTAVQPADLDTYATDAELATGLSTKQDTINDLSEIRSGAAAGATALQPSDLAAVATSGDYDDLIDKPTIPSGTQLVPSATASDEDKVLTVNSQGIPEWAESQGLFIAQYGTTTYDDIDAAARAGKIVYCYVYGRFAFLAYTNTAGTDHNYEFQYYRSAASGKDSVFIYKVRPAGSAYGHEWETTQRDVKAGNISYPVTRVDVNGSSAMAGTVAEITIPTKTSDITNDSGFITGADVPVKDVEVDGASVVNAQGVAEITMPDLSGYATTQDLTTGLASKQDTISDLSTIRSGAAEGASAVQPGDLAAVATTGSYNSLSDKPSIPTVDQAYNASSTNAQSGTAVAQAISSVDAVPDVTSSDSGKVLVATYSGGTGSYAWASTPPANAIILDSSSTWSDFHTPYSAGRKDIYYKHTSPFAPFESRAELYLHLTAVSDVDGSSSNFTYALFEGAWQQGGEDYSVRCKFRYSASPIVSTTSWIVDQSYSSSSRRAQSGVAVAQAISGVNQVPSSTSADADKVLTVDSQGTPTWASAQAPISAGTGISITNNVVSVDNTVAMKSDLPTATSDLTNDSGFITLSDVPAQVNADWNSVSGASEILNKPTIPSGAQLVPAATSADADKVLKVNAQGTPEWDTGGSDDGADWDAEQGEPGYIENKPVPKTLTAGTGIHITENASTIIVASTVTAPVRDVTVDGSSVVSNGVAAITTPTVDQTYDASSTNAQSGVAVADAIGNLGTNLSAAQLLALKEALGVDETVLWEGSAASSFTVSENITNFEYLRVYINYNGMNSWCYGTIVSNAQFTIACVSYANKSGDGNRLQLFGGSFTSSNGLAFSSESGKCIYFANDSPTIGGGSTIACNILKVVGIHRIASN